MEENRTFSFWVSDHRDIGAEEPWKPRFVNGEDLGMEWEAALTRFWRERKRVEEMKRVAEMLMSRGFGKLAWLEKQDASGREWNKDGKEKDDDDEDEDWYYLGESSEEEEDDEESGGKRRDSGGGK